MTKPEVASPDTADQLPFSMIVVSDAREKLLGPRSHGFVIAQKCLRPERIFHVMRWFGQAQRAFDLLCHRTNERIAFGSSFGATQFGRKMIFDTYTEIQSCRLPTLDAVAKIARGGRPRIELEVIKAVRADRAHNAIDRAMYVRGTKELTPDAPLERMHRHARADQIYERQGAAHVDSTVRQQLVRIYERDEA